MDYTLYTCKGPTRWDQVAYEAYGDVNKMNLIIEANKGVTISNIIPDGTQLRIPIQSQPEIVEDNLPPWKR